MLDSVTSALHFAGPLLYALVLVESDLGDRSVWPILVAFLLWGMGSHAFGAVQDMTAMFASIREEGRSIGAGIAARDLRLAELGRKRDRVHRAALDAERVARREHDREHCHAGIRLTCPAHRVADGHGCLPGDVPQAQRQQCGRPRQGCRGRCGQGGRQGQGRVVHVDDAMRVAHGDRRRISERPVRQAEVDRSRSFSTSLRNTVRSSVGGVCCSTTEP